MEKKDFTKELLECGVVFSQSGLMILSLEGRLSENYYSNLIKTLFLEKFIEMQFWILGIIYWNAPSVQ